MDDDRDNETGKSEAAGESPADTVSALPSNVTDLTSAERREKFRIIEALLFAANEPLDEITLAKHLQEDDDVRALLEELQSFYAGRGVNLVRVARKWAFRTAEDLSYLLERYAVQQKRLSRAALETLSIISYHQPATRAEIEQVRGVSTSKGTLDVLLETGWVRMRGRRKVPGRPVTYGTTDAFLEHFGFETIRDLPGLKELRGSGLLEGNLPPGFSVPSPDDSSILQDDETGLDEPDDQVDLPLDIESETITEEDSHQSGDNSVKGHGTAG